MTDSTSNNQKKVVVKGKQTRRSGSRVRRFRRVSEPKPIQLTDRDVEVLRALAMHRMLSGKQLGQLVFQCGASRVRRRLRALYDHGFVDRRSVVAQPTRGVPPVVYALTKRGADALVDLGEAAPGGGVSGAGHEFVRHQLLINDFYISLTEAVRNTPYRIENWRHEQQLKLEGANGRGRAEQIEHRLLPQRTSFLPDAYFELSVGPNRSFAYFLEIDLATHAQRVWRQRALLYTAYADGQAGLFRRRFGRETFRALIVTTPDYRNRSRCNNVLASIGETVGPSDLFLGATLADIRADQLLQPIWRPVGNRRRVSIVGNREPTPVRVNGRGGSQRLTVRPAEARALEPQGRL